MNILIKKILRQRRTVTKLFFAALCPCIILVSCSKKEEKIPENILPKEKMIHVMVDVQIAEAAIQNKNLNLNDSTKAIAAGYYRNLFEKNKITEQQFRESFLYYSHHLDLWSKIYEEVINELSKKQAVNANK